MHSTITANGLDFAILEEGDGPLALLLHGFPDTPHSWDHTRPALAAAGFRAVSPYMRGYAPTSIPDDGAYDSDTLGRDVLALIEALGHESAIVIGHDWGASAAYSAASLDPSKVSLLITVAIPHPGSIKPSLRLLWGGRHFLSLRTRGATKRAAKNNFALIDELVKRWSPTWDVPAEETAAVKESFASPGCLDAALGYYRAVGLRPPSSHRGRISVPTVSFAGLDDGVLRVSDYEKARSRFEDRYDIIEMPGGHFLHREHPQRFVDELLAVLPSTKLES